MAIPPAALGNISKGASVKIGAVGASPFSVIIKINRYPSGKGSQKGRRGPEQNDSLRNLDRDVALSSRRGDVTATQYHTQRHKSGPRTKQTENCPYLVIDSALQRSRFVRSD